VSEKGDAGAIRTISDTARWVAVYRAMETERPDAIFHDPYARRLAGERGEQIVRGLRRGKGNAWSMIVRTAVLDELILKLVSAESIDLVVNLAAGLDTRPYRLALPAGLRWVEVDLAEMIDYKAEEMKSETPRCALERVTLDLADEAARRAFFAKLDAGAQRILVITEGLLGYLTEEQVTSLAKDLRACAHFRFWLSDIASPRVKEMLNKNWGKQLSAANAPFHFAPANSSEFFHPLGWQTAEFRDFLYESRRLNRKMAMDWMIRIQEKVAPGWTAKQMAQWKSGVVLLRRA